MDRRTFLSALAATTVACSSDRSTGNTPEPGDGGTSPPDDGRYAWRRPGVLIPNRATLTGAPGTADIGGRMAPGWLLNGSLPSPTIDVRRGDPFRLQLQNQLAQDLILHWHGLAPPVAMDGHPRFAIGPSRSFDYDFTVQERAGTYWYHSHTHHLTGEQTYRGIGGLLLVRDAEEDALGLPSGPRELPLILQDRLLDAAGLPMYAPTGPAMMAGVMGPEGFVNGRRRSYLDVDTALYRLRVLNGSNARIMRLGRGDGGPFTLVGNDGGLLPAPVTLTSVDLAPGERADLLLDLRGLPVGTRLMLRSLAFTMAGGMGFMGGANLQGQALDLLELRVTRAVSDAAVLPSALPPVPGPTEGEAQRERTFRFSSQQMSHRINGAEFAMERVDATVPFDQTEVWTFVNESGLPHPVHVHATHFRVVSRSGGRGAVQAWEAGRKDTVLLHPFETVRVAIRFTAQRGLFLLHCHNLEHEDHGMMANILVE